MKLFDKKMCLLLFLILLLFSAMSLFGLRDSLDIKLYYTGEQASMFLSALSPTQTRAYIINEILDLFFLLTYTATLTLALTRLFPQHPKILILALAPGLFDLIETASILCLLASPSPSPSYLGLATALKWSTAFIALLTITLASLKRR